MNSDRHMAAMLCGYKHEIGASFTRVPDCSVVNVQIVQSSYYAVNYTSYSV